MALATTTCKANRIKCVSCGETIRKFEKYINLGPGERYCTGCEDIALENNPDAGDDCQDDDDGERHLRQMEDFGAYQAAGCTGAYWGDRDAGYAH